MNKNIIKACLNPGIDIENAIKREIVKEVIDKYFSYDEITYDGNVISAYDIYSLITDKMNYIKDMCNFDNYVFNQKEVNKILGKDFNYRPNIKINQDKSLFFEFNNFLCGRMLGFYVYFNDNDISYKLKRYFNKQYNYGGNYLDGYFYNSKYTTLSYSEAERFIKIFINDNKKILLDLLTTINNLGGNRDRYEQTIVGDDYKLKYIFSLIIKEAKLYLTFYDLKGHGYKLRELELVDYVNDNKEYILKRISINIDELDPFFRNEIDKYYNSINSIEYKYYKKEKSL